MTENEYPVPLAGAQAPVLMWAHEHEIESSAVQQLRSVAELPGLYGLRVMPDVHWGNGATVGSVIAMEQALAPAAVGVDIGCGVNAVRTDLKLEDLDATDLRQLRERFENTVPVGFHSHDEMVETRPLGIQGAEKFFARFKDLTVNVKDREARAAHQLGTLGGGNHFIELCTDSAGFIWITLHSGSRNIGKEIAEQHIALAKELPVNQDLPGHLRDLSLFYKGTPEMDAYLHDLRWAQHYAALSRTIMMELIKNQVARHFSSRAIMFDQEINCHHNYVAVEEIDGREMIVTRKGAISAKEGELALIPGSMATGSYIVRGKGNAASFQSASHGAGRKLSRGAAKRLFAGEDGGASEIAEQLGNVESRRDAGILDELPGAYKNLDDVVAAQSDLVDIVERLETVLCVKG